MLELLWNAPTSELKMAAVSAALDEWDRFEWSYQRAVERQAALDPNNPDLVARLGRRRTWMEAYLRDGREVLGYGTYLFRRPLVDPRVGLGLGSRRAGG